MLVGSKSPLDSKEMQPVHPRGNLSWIFTGRTDAETETPILQPPDANWLIGKDPDSGQDWRQEEKGTDRGWDGWMASLTQWTWVWASSRSQWWIGQPSVLQSMSLQRVGHDWVTELNCLLVYVCVHTKSLQSCPILCGLVDCSPPGSTVHGILQARILELVGMPCPASGDLPDPEIQPTSLISPAL